MAITRVNGRLRFAGVSTDPFPTLTAKQRGAECYIEDTDSWKRWDGTQWLDYTPVSGAAGGSSSTSTPTGTSTYKGVWSAGVYAVGDIVYHAGDFYIASAARTATNTDNPASDSTWWNISDVSDDSITLAKLAHATSSDFNSLFGVDDAGVPILTNPPRHRGSWAAGSVYLVGDSVRWHGRIYVAGVEKTSSNRTSPVDDQDWIEIGRFLDRAHLNRYIFENFTATAFTSDTDADVYGSTLVAAINSRRLRVGHGNAATVKLRFESTTVIANLDGRSESRFPIRFLVWRQNGGNISFNTAHSRMNAGAGAISTMFEVDTVREVTIESDGAAQRNYTVSMSDILSWTTLVRARTYDKDATEFYVALYGARHYMSEIIEEQGGLPAEDVIVDASDAVHP